MKIIRGVKYPARSGRRTLPSMDSGRTTAMAREYRKPVQMQFRMACRTYGLLDFLLVAPRGRYVCVTHGLSKGASTRYASLRTLSLWTTRCRNLNVSGCLVQEKDKALINEVLAVVVRLDERGLVLSLLGGQCLPRNLGGGGEASSKAHLRVAVYVCGSCCCYVDENPFF